MARRGRDETAARGLTRRDLLRGGGGAAGLAALAAGARPASAFAQEERRRPNVVVIVAERMRSDYVGAYDDVFDDRKAKTPNIDKLADQSLRFRYATPDGMPGIPMRRGLLTGMRSYPFRDWRRTPGMPAIPGWNKVYDYQPLLPSLTSRNGVRTVWVTDNPSFNHPTVQRTVRPLPLSSNYEPTERDYLLPLRGPVTTRRDEPTQRVLRRGIELIDELKGRQPFFLALDAFDPADAFMNPRQFRGGKGPLDDHSNVPRSRAYMDAIKVDVDGDVTAEVRDRYVAELERVDAMVGRFLDKLDDAGLADDTVVVFTSDSGIALGEQLLYGHPSGVWHRRLYHVPLLIRDPDRRWAGDTSSWFVSTYDIPTTLLSYLDIVIPGRMAGEDLTTLFDDYDLPNRPYFTTGIDSHVVVGDRHFLLIGRTDQDRWRLYEAEDEDDPDDIRSETVKSPTVLATMRRWALTAAGGTLPEFGDDEAIRPRQPKDLDKAVADDGTLDEDEQEANELR